jgi:Zn-finger nucleic acid-binding protein
VARTTTLQYGQLERRRQFVSDVSWSGNRGELEKLMNASAADNRQPFPIDMRRHRSSHRSRAREPLAGGVSRTACDYRRDDHRYDGDRYRKKTRRHFRHFRR